MRNVVNKEYDPSYCVGLDLGKRIMADAGVLVCKCQKCGGIKHVDVSIDPVFPPCNTCGPVNWDYDVDAIRLLRENGFIG